LESIMKIGNPADTPAPAPASQAAPAGAAANGSAAQAGGAAAASAGDASATVALSSTASTLLSGNAAPEFDAEKVARISKAIDDGSFQVNPEAIADKLIANAQELLAKFQS
jgi:negative regulator of flagellin synthesis FlgM